MFVYLFSYLTEVIFFHQVILCCLSAIKHTVIFSEIHNSCPFFFKNETFCHVQYVAMVFVCILDANI